MKNKDKVFIINSNSGGIRHFLEIGSLAVVNRVFSDRYHVTGKNEDGTAISQTIHPASCIPVTDANEGVLKLLYAKNN